MQNLVGGGPRKLGCLQRICFGPVPLGSLDKRFWYKEIDLLMVRVNSKIPFAKLVINL